MTPPRNPTRSAPAWTRSRSAWRIWSSTRPTAAFLGFMVLAVGRTVRAPIVHSFGFHTHATPKPPSTRRTPTATSSMPPTGSHPPLASALADCHSGVVVRGWALYGCDLSDHISALEFKGAVSAILALLPGDLQQYVTAPHPFRRNWQIAAWPAAFAEHGRASATAFKRPLLAWPLCCPMQVRTGVHAVADQPRTLVGDGGQSS